MEFKIGDLLYFKRDIGDKSSIPAISVVIKVDTYPYIIIYPVRIYKGSYETKQFHVTSYTATHRIINLG